MSCVATEVTVAASGERAGRAGLERILTVAVLCGLSGSVERLRYSMLSAEIMTALTWLVLLVSCGLMLRRRAAVIASLRAIAPASAIVALALLSISWSVAPEVSAKRVLELVAITAFALYVGSRFSPVQQLELLLTALCLVALYSVAGALLSPHGIRWTSRGFEVRGWYTSNNHLGRSMSVATVAACVLAFVPGRRRLAIAAAAWCFAVLLSSTSRSAVLVTIASIGGFWLLGAAQRWPSRVRPMFGAAVGFTVVVGVAVARYGEVVFAWIGRDVTLSRRTVMWDLLADQWIKRPWLGYGYGAFWRQGAQEARSVAEQLGYYPWHAHNGFVDLALELGAVGVALFTAILLFTAARALHAGLAARARWQLWPAVYLGYFVVSNLTESELVRHGSIYWVLFICAVIQAGSAQESPPSLPRRGRGGGSAGPARSDGLFQ